MFTSILQEDIFLLFGILFLFFVLYLELNRNPVLLIMTSSKLPKAFFSMFLTTHIIDMGHLKINIIFTGVFLDLLVVFVEYLVHTDPTMHYSTYYLVFLNLSIAYFLTDMTMWMIIDETAVRRQLIFSGHNLLKVALILVIEFLVELTFLSYLGNCYFDNAYNKTVSLFDVYYYTVVTFGTVGYGDIYPTAIYTKGTAILTTFTSIACIAVMLSSLLSAALTVYKKK